MDEIVDGWNLTRFNFFCVMKMSLHVFLEKN